MSDSASSSIQNRAVRGEADYPGVGRWTKAGELLRGQRGDDLDRLLGERLQRALHQPSVILELR